MVALSLLRMLLHPYLLFQLPLRPLRPLLPHHEHYQKPTQSHSIDPYLRQWVLDQFDNSLDFLQERLLLMRDKASDKLNASSLLIISGKPVYTHRRRTVTHFIFLAMGDILESHDLHSSHVHREELEGKIVVVMYDTRNIISCINARHCQS